MKSKGRAIIVVTPLGIKVAKEIQRECPDYIIYSREEAEGCVHITSTKEAVTSLFPEVETLIVIGSLGICVRSIAPYIEHKYHDPAVICIDSLGLNVIPVLSGHIGGANKEATRIARCIGAREIITTQSDNTNLWALDTIAPQYQWERESVGSDLNRQIATFVNKEPVALLLDIKNEGTAYLERTCPEHVELFYDYEEISEEGYKLLIVVSPFIYENKWDSGILYYRPKILHMGVGCQKNCGTDGAPELIQTVLASYQISTKSIRSISTIELKKEEKLVNELTQIYTSTLHIFTAEELQGIEVPNPSDKVGEVTGSRSVSEASALRASDNGILLVEKEKGGGSSGNYFTFSVAIESGALRKGHLEIVGAGPGDPELISVRGKQFLESADLILYAGSLVPIELTHYAKVGATVKSSADMNLEEQVALMKKYYDQGKLIVRLHTGDPCIYGAIQEQMALFDEVGMRYHITPGISSFQAAAAALRSEFTIPEKVQTIILTRGEGRTPMPEKEQLHLLARSQSTMCIYLSANIVEKVERELLVHYPPTTPVAVCYKLTWKEERIFQGELQNLSQIVRSNNLTLTTMIVVGEAINNRKGLSRLYADEFKHIFRK